MQLAAIEDWDPLCYCGKKQLSYKAAVANLGTGDQFHGRQLFPGPGAGGCGVVGGGGWCRAQAVMHGPFPTGHSLGVGTADIKYKLYM